MYLLLINKKNTDYARMYIFLCMLFSDDHLSFAE